MRRRLFNLLAGTGVLAKVGKKGGGVSSCLAPLLRGTGALALLTAHLALGDEQLPSQARAYRPPPPTRLLELPEPRSFCPEGRIPPLWRESQTIDGVEIAEEPTCLPDNPFLVAAAVRGTNNVSLPTLLNTPLAPDAVLKRNDLDGDGDPDEITIKLEIAELGGASPDTLQPVYGFEVAPGVVPAAIAFVPKGRGPALLKGELSPLYRLPSPVIRVEQGDRVELILENSHYLPHTLHLQGVDHPFATPEGEGNDGTPPISEPPLAPGERRVYRFTPKAPGTFLYLDLAHPAFPRLGLVGMIVVEENRPDNWVQTLNLGGGKVRHPSRSVREAFDQEYDLIFGGISESLEGLLRSSNDPRVVALHLQQLPLPKAPDRLLLNGRGFPYTLREAPLVEVNQKVLLHLLNARSQTASIRFHGHRLLPSPQEEGALRDTLVLGPWERRDLVLRTVGDGLHASGPGLWPFGSEGAAAGSDLSALLYKAFLDEKGLPRFGEEIAPYLTEAFQEGKVALWQRFGLGVPEVLVDQLFPQEPGPSEKPPIVRSPFWNFFAGLLLGLLAYVLFSNRERAVELVRRHLLGRKSP